MNKVRVVKEHPQTKDIFPLGFETTFRKVYTEEDKVYKGYWTSIHGERQYVEAVVIPKGTFKDVLFIANNGKEYSSDWFYKCTGKSVTDFMEKLN